MDVRLTFDIIQKKKRGNNNNKIQKEKDRKQVEGFERRDVCECREKDASTR